MTSSVSFASEIASGIINIIDHKLNTIDVITSINGDELMKYNSAGGQMIIDVLGEGLVVEQSAKMIILEFKELQYIIKYMMLSTVGNDIDIQFKITRIATSRSF